jgi:hypothetical protein
MKKGRIFERLVDKLSSEEYNDLEFTVIPLAMVKAHYWRKKAARFNGSISVMMCTYRGESLLIHLNTFLI